MSPLHDTRVCGRGARAPDHRLAHLFVRTVRGVGISTICLRSTHGRDMREVDLRQSTVRTVPRRRYGCTEDVQPRRSAQASGRILSRRLTCRRAARTTPSPSSPPHSATRPLGPARWLIARSHGGPRSYGWLWLAQTLMHRRPVSVASSSTGRKVRPREAVMGAWAARPRPRWHPLQHVRSGMRGAFICVAFHLHSPYSRLWNPREACRLPEKDAAGPADPACRDSPRPVVSRHTCSVGNRGGRARTRIPSVCLPARREWV